MKFIANYFILLYKEQAPHHGGSINRDIKAHNHAFASIPVTSHAPSQNAIEMQYLSQTPIHMVTLIYPSAAKLLSQSHQLSSFSWWQLVNQLLWHIQNLLYQLVIGIGSWYMLLWGRCSLRWRRWIQMLILNWRSAHWHAELAAHVRWRWWISGWKGAGYRLAVMLELRWNRLGSSFNNRGKCISWDETHEK